MAATLIDPEQEKESEAKGGYEDNSVSDHQEDMYEGLTVEEAVEETPEEPEVEELPDKYKGKTVAEIAKMHQEAESALGRQSNEVGELRKAFDDFVTSSVEKRQAPEPEEEVDFFLDPDKAVQRAIDNHPKLKEAEAVTAEMKKQQSLAMLKSAFPDMNETLGNPKFIEWVQASPVRMRLFKEADKSYDYDSAAELFSNWAERTQVVKQTKQVEKQAQKNEVKKASTGSSRSNPDARRTKKVFRRSDIIRLMRTDPARYESMSDEIMQAYAEGRVK